MAKALFENFFVQRRPLRRNKPAVIKGVQLRFVKHQALNVGQVPVVFVGNDRNGHDQGVL